MHTLKRVTNLFYSQWDRAFMLIGAIIFGATGVVMLLRNLNMGWGRLLVGLSAMSFCLCFGGACLSLYIGMHADLTSERKTNTVVSTIICFILGAMFLMLAIMFATMNFSKS